MTSLWIGKNALVNWQGSNGQSAEHFVKDRLLVRVALVMRRHDLMDLTPRYEEGETVRRSGRRATCSGRAHRLLEHECGQNGGNYNCLGYPSYCIRGKLSTCLGRPREPFFDFKTKLGVMGRKRKGYEFESEAVTWSIWSVVYRRTLDTSAANAERWAAKESTQEGFTVSLIS